MAELGRSLPQKRPPARDGLGATPAGRFDIHSANEAEPLATLRQNERKSFLSSRPVNGDGHPERIFVMIRVIGSYELYELLYLKLLYFRTTW